MDHSKEALRVYFSKKKRRTFTGNTGFIQFGHCQFVFKTTYLGVRIFSSVFTYIPQKVR